MTLGILLPGFHAILSGEDSSRIELHSSSSSNSRAFVRLTGDTWEDDDRQSEPLHAHEIREIIQREFPMSYDRLVCSVGEEDVVYEMEGSALRVTRKASKGSSERRKPKKDDMERLAAALGIPASKRKAKFKQASLLAGIVDKAMSDRAAKRDLRVLDLACGRSYLGFALSQFLDASGYKVKLHGVDSEPELVEKCHVIAAELGWTNASFEVADLSSGYSVPVGSYDVVVSLHGCDTLTDEAIRVGVEARCPYIFVVPCCQHEVRHQLKEHPLRWIAKYGLLEQRLADVLTDGFRCLALEAMGYQVNVLRFCAAEITPKNLLIQARLNSGDRRSRARDAEAFTRQFGVHPRLACMLEEAGLVSPRE